MAHRVPVRLRRHEQIPLSQDLDDPAVGLGLGKPRECARVLVHVPVEPDHGELREPVRLPDVEVHRIVARGDLDRAGAELGIDTIVRDDRDAPLGDGHDRLLPDEVAVALVVRMHRDGDVREHGRRAHRGNRELAFALRKGIANRVQGVVLVEMIDLEVGDRAGAARTPVDDSVRAIQEAPVVQVHEVPEHRPDVRLVHREALAPVVERRSEPAELPHDHAAVVVEPLPRPLDERVTSELVPAESLLRELALDDVLCRDSRVVVSGLPEHRKAAHAVPADEQVLDRRVQRVPHVQIAGHVRRRDRDHEGLAFGIRLGLVQALRLPRLLPARFDALG